MQTLFIIYKQLSEVKKFFVIQNEKPRIIFDNIDRLQLFWKSAKVNDWPIPEKPIMQPNLFIWPIVVSEYCKIQVVNLLPL